MTPVWAGHGTEGGWLAHRKAGEQPCEPCALAHRMTNHVRKTARRERRRMISGRL